MTGLGGEAARKTLHVAASLVAAAVVWRFDPTAAAAILAAAAGVALLVELGRHVSPGFGAAFQARLGPMLRPAETRRLTGATTLALGFTAAAVLVPGRAALMGILVVGIADAAAAVIGRRWGRHRYPGGKSVEGSVVFLVLAFPLVLAMGVPPFPALAVAATVTVLESLSLPLDDNLYLPAAGAAVFRAITGV